MEPHRLTKSHTPRSHARSPGKTRSTQSPSRESKRKKSSSSNSLKNSSKLPPIPKPPAPYGSSYSWDAAHGKALLDKVTQRAESGPQRVDGSPTENKDAPYLALVQLFNQFEGTPIDTKKTLVSVSVLGSTGPLRMLVTSDAKVKDVIQMALLKYAHEGRVPSLGRDVGAFDLYDSQFSCHGALNHEDRIAEAGTRKFALCPNNNLKASSSSSCASESKASARSTKSWWSYVTGIKSLV